MGRSRLDVGSAKASRLAGRSCKNRTKRRRFDNNQANLKVNDFRIGLCIVALMAMRAGNGEILTWHIQAVVCSLGPTRLCHFERIESMSGCRGNDGMREKSCRKLSQRRIRE